MPSPIIIRIAIKPHLKDYLIHTNGKVHPITAVERSVPGVILKQFLAKTPKDFKPDPNPDELMMFLPFYTDKDPRIYNYISKDSEKMFERLIENIFWTTYINFINENYQPKSERESLKKGGIKDLTERFMQNNGINPDHITMDAFIKRYRRDKNILKNTGKSFEVLSFKSAQLKRGRRNFEKKRTEIHFRIDQKKKKRLKRYCQENNISMVDLFNDVIDQIVTD